MNRRIMLTFTLTGVIVLLLAMWPAADEPVEAAPFFAPSATPGGASAGQYDTAVQDSSLQVQAPSRSRRRTSTPTSTPTADRGTRTSTPSPTATRVPTATSTPGPSRTPVPASPTASPPQAVTTVKLGAFVNGFVWTNQFQDEFESMVGRRMDIVHWFQPWGQERTNGDYQPALDREALNRAAARGQIPMITWEAWGRLDGVDPSHVANIPTGAFDAYIDSWAQGIAAYGQPVYLRLFHEMNITYYPWSFGVSGNSADDLVAAWRHIHDRFVRAGATNVSWVWCLNTEDDLISFRALYPGDAYVDWFAVDGYNGGTELPYKGGWKSPESLFARSFAAFSALHPGKPVMIAETSSVEAGGGKAQWIKALLLDLPPKYPSLKAILWFQFDGRPDPIQADWRVNTSPAALDAYRAAVAPAR